MIGYFKNGKQMTERQRRFANEIIKYKLNKDEAYAELVNSKYRFGKYREFEEVIDDYFNNY